MNIFLEYDSLPESVRIEENKKLVEKYPFLLPKNAFTGESLSDYDYSWTVMDSIPEGWRIAFAELFFDELKEELERVNYLNDYRVIEVKEKFGSLRWYTTGVPKDSKLYDIASKYEILSQNICILCGKPDVPMVAEYWISPYCKPCWVKHNGNVANTEELYDKYTQNSEFKMSNLLSWTTFTPKGSEEHKLDISETAEKIRKNFTRNEG